MNPLEVLFFAGDQLYSDIHRSIMGKAKMLRIGTAASKSCCSGYFSIAYDLRFALFKDPYLGARTPGLTAGGVSDFYFQPIMVCTQVISIKPEIRLFSVTEVKNDVEISIIVEVNIDRTSCKATLNRP